jgi:hypothetical protein
MPTALQGSFDGDLERRSRKCSAAIGLGIGNHNVGMVIDLNLPAATTSALNALSIRHLNAPSMGITMTHAGIRSHPRRHWVD